MISTPSNRPEFEGFAAFYADEIAPFLAAKEGVRQAAVKEAGLVAIVVGGAIVILLVFRPLGEISGHIAAFAGIGGFSLAGWRLSRARNAITEGLLGRICKGLGFGYRRDLPRPSYFPTFDRLKLLPDFNEERWEDEVAGARHGADLVFCEGHLEHVSRGKRRGRRTVFHGQLFMIDYHKEFLGETVIKRDRGVFNRLMKPGKGFQNVGIASPKFEKIFEAWSTDQVEARDLLDPIVLERFEELERLFEGANLRAAFVRGKLYVALETGDKLNMGSMFTPLDGPERVEAILKEFDVVFDLIDVILQRIDGRVADAFSLEHVKNASV